MCQNWLLMDENEINKDAGKGPKLGGTADKHIRPCQIDGRDVFFIESEGKDDKSRVTRTNRNRATGLASP